MGSLLASAIVLTLLSFFIDGEPTAIIYIVNVGLLVPTLGYLYTEIAGKICTNFLGLFCVATNFWCILSLVLSINQGAGSIWSFASLINHPLTPLQSFATISDYIGALAYNSTLLSLLFMVSHVTSIRNSNAKLNAILQKALLKVYLGLRRLRTMYLLLAFVFLYSVSFDLGGGLGGAGLQGSFLGLLIQWTWLLSLPLTAMGLFSLIGKNISTVLDRRNIPFYLCVVGQLVFTLLLGRRTILYAFVSILFYFTKLSLYLGSLTPSLALASVKKVIYRFKSFKTYFYLLIWLFGFTVLRALLNTYQILRVQTDSLSFGLIYSSLFSSLFGNSDYIEVIRNESQASRLLILSPLAQLIANYHSNPSIFQGNSLGEVINPFLNSVPNVVLSHLTTISKSDLLFGQATLQKILGFNIDFPDILSAIAFSAFDYFALIVFPLLAGLVIAVYYAFSLRVICPKGLAIDFSFWESIKLLAWIAVTVYTAVGGFTDESLATYFRSFAVALFIASILTFVTQNIFAPRTISRT